MMDLGNAFGLLIKLCIAVIVVLVLAVIVLAVLLVRRPSEKVIEPSVGFQSTDQNYRDIRMNDETRKMSS